MSRASLPPQAPVVLDAPRRLMPIVTPEGVPLEFGLADVGDRLGAFLLDVVMITGILLLLLVTGLLFSIPGGFLAHYLVQGLWLIVPLYFAWHELRGAGQTPGKRRTGLRVISAEAGPLTTEMLLIRNMVRLLEVHLPLTVALEPDVFWPHAPGWTVLLAMGWLMAFLLMPLFNRDRMRIGDMLAGTRVVVHPPSMLLGDLSDRKMAQGGDWHFTPEQLTVYGVYELQVLEHLLRQPRDAAIRDAMTEVARRIRRKIQWEGKIARKDVESFLASFYRQLRQHQEGRLLLGKRKDHKAASEGHATEE